jgi:hypothetical protein
MTITQFLERLENVSQAYHWDLNGNRVVATIQSGPHKGVTLNPITALAHKSGLGCFNNTREGSELAGQMLGLTRNFTRKIYSATVGTYNRGNTQVVRGRIRSALEV